MAQTKAQLIDGKGDAVVNNKLLVGTSSGPSAGLGQYSLLVVQGYAGNTAGSGEMSISRGEAASSITTGEGIGTLNFCDNAGNTFGYIGCVADGTAGTNDYPGRLVFSTTADGASSPTERMRITNGGTVGIGSSAPSAWVSTRQVIQIGRAASACDTGVSNGGSSIFSNNFYYDGSDRAVATGYSQGIVFNPTGAGTTQVVSTSGTNTGGNAITFTGGPFVAAGGTSWTSSSDERLKNIIEPITDGLDRVAEIRAVKFSWKDDPDERINVGVIAQDVEAVLPEIVSKSQKYGSDDQTEYLGVSYDLLAPLLIAALQEAKTKIETLEAKVAALESA